MPSSDDPGVEQSPMPKERNAEKEEDANVSKIITA
jgi:hypothetical protein